MQAKEHDLLPAAGHTFFRMVWLALKVLPREFPILKRCKVNKKLRNTAQRTQCKSTS